ncbi:MAG: hypothetical protein GX649_14955 [Chloroflexi bacterium]|nr:hypothetical protein [Chloroflexota bacterium]
MELYGFAALTPEQLARVQETERETGTRLLVLRALEIAPDNLTTDQLEALQRLEGELGNIILAVE